MKRLFAFLFALTLGSGSLTAKPRTKTYALTCDRVWKAVETVASSGEYVATMLDDRRHKAQFTMGKGAWNSQRSIFVTLDNSEANCCAVTVEGTFSGFAHNDKGDLFKRLDAALPTESK